MESVSAVKDILYQELNKITEFKIQLEISKNNSQQVINQLVSKCSKKIIQIPGDMDENFGILAESLMHYLITISGVPSQRKIVLDKTDLDIVIPDLKTIKENPEDALIVCFPKSRIIEEVQQRVVQIKKNIPHENIWLVLYSDLPVNEKKYIVNSNNNSFSQILEDIIKFLAKRKQSKFRILKS
jgi:hypothetical protein